MKRCKAHENRRIQQKETKINMDISKDPMSIFIVFTGYSCFLRFPNQDFLSSQDFPFRSDSLKIAMKITSYVWYLKMLEISLPNSFNDIAVPLNQSK